MDDWKDFVIFVLIASLIIGFSVFALTNRELKDENFSIKAKAVELGYAEFLPKENEFVLVWKE